MWPSFCRRFFSCQMFCFTGLRVQRRYATPGWYRAANSTRTNSAFRLKTNNCNVSYFVIKSMQYRQWRVYFDENSYNVFRLKLGVACLKSSPSNMWVWDYWLRPSLSRAHFKTHSDQSVMRSLKCCDISYLGTSRINSFSGHSGLGWFYLFRFIVVISKNVEQ
jgi:hypothetical protein